MGTVPRDHKGGTELETQMSLSEFRVDISWSGPGAWKKNLNQRNEEYGSSFSFNSIFLKRKKIVTLDLQKDGKGRT